MYKYYLHEKGNVVEAAVFMRDYFLISLLFSYIFLQSRRSLPFSYSPINLKWEYRRKAVVASSIINAQEQVARGLGHSSIPLKYSDSFNLFLILNFFLSPFTSVIETENTRVPIISIFYYIQKLKIKTCL